MLLNIPRFLVNILIIGALVLVGCSGERIVSTNTSPALSTTSQATQTSIKANTETTAASEKISESFPGMKELPRLEGKATVVITVKGSPITIEVDGTNAPITAGNFVDLVDKGVYDGLAFHRVIREPQPFVVQGGDPLSKDPQAAKNSLGSGSYIDPKTRKARYIPLEIKPKGEASPIYSKTFEMAGLTNTQPELQHKLGAVAMARSQMPDSASSQFYFSLGKLDFLDGNYAVFGYVTEGFEVVNQIQQGDIIDSAKVSKGLENLKKPA